MKISLISITPNPEKVIELAGRTSYLSFDKYTEFPILEASPENSREFKIFRTEDFPELKNLNEGDEFSFEKKKWKIHKKWRNSAEKFIKMIIRNGHLSVLEHAYATFRISGGSRSFTHQLVRHRLASYTQQSQRYVDEENFNYIIPDSIKKNKEAKKIYNTFIEQSRDSYKKLKELGIPKQDARFVLPNAIESEIVVSANFREWRHIIDLRGNSKAQWEIRKAIIKILKILKKKAPIVFDDYILDEKKILITKKEQRIIKSEVE
ncbi:MAG: FAD-dependent thymidylate synthase [Acidobacteriota bacterium]